MQSFLYAALGDSTGVGVGARDGRGGYVARLYARLSAHTPEASLLNLCASGATSRAVVQSQLPRATSRTPALATVFVGINDLIQGVAPETFAENLEHVATSLARIGTRALFCTLPDLAYAPAAVYFTRALGVQRRAFETRTLAFNQRIGDSARRHGHALADLFTISLADRAHFFSDDGFHPSAHGYDELAATLWPQLVSLLPREATA